MKVRDWKAKSSRHRGCFNGNQFSPLFLSLSLTSFGPWHGEEWILFESCSWYQARLGRWSSWWFSSSSFSFWCSMCRSRRMLLQLWKQQAEDLTRNFCTRLKLLRARQESDLAQWNSAKLARIDCICSMLLPYVLYFCFWFVKHGIAWWSYDKYSWMYGNFVTHEWIFGFGSC